ncbi:MAG: hypothetical protein K1W19_08245 [Lachnospiraceae bacterium]
MEGDYKNAKKSLISAKLIVNIESNKHTKQIKTVSVFDNRTQSYWTDEQIQERGITRFLNLDDLKETLNWNLNGDSKKYQFKWGQSGKYTSEGCAYVF